MGESVVAGFDFAERMTRLILVETFGAFLPGPGGRFRLAAGRSGVGLDRVTIKPNESAPPGCGAFDLDVDFFAVDFFAVGVFAVAGFFTPDLLTPDFVTGFLRVGLAPEDRVSVDLLPDDFTPDDFVPDDFVPADLPPDDAVLLPDDADLLPGDADLLPGDFVPDDFVPARLVPEDLAPIVFGPLDLELPGLVDEVFLRRPPPAAEPREFCPRLPPALEVGFLFPEFEVRLAMRNKIADKHVKAYEGRQPTNNASLARFSIS